MSDLFDSVTEERLSKLAPLATRMRPQSLDDVVGLPALLGERAAFRRVVETGSPISMLLWGPPGTGKTTLARLVANHASASFETLSATSAGVKDVRAVIAGARQRLAEQETRTVLFIDEIHRFNKNQQDALLPSVEDGTLVLIGATTENPFFEVNSPLMSRMSLFKTKSLEPVDLEILVARALSSSEGLADAGLKMDPDAASALTSRSGGDARHALNALEVAASLASGRDSDTIDLEDVEEALQRRIVRYDKSGDQHYDVISAFIKSVRGSDPDASLYWLHLMLEAGEDPEFIARRLIILASEDVGMADPNGLSIAVAAADALAYVGLPEAAYHLSHATVYLATAPKSNSIGIAMMKSKETVSEGPAPSVPLHLRSAGYQGARQLGHGDGYQYSHDAPGHVSRQQFFPDGVVPRFLYRPTAQGAEELVKERLRWIDEVLGKPGRDDDS